MDDVEPIISRYFALHGITFKTDVPPWLREQLVMGYRVEMEHGSRLDTRLNITRDSIPVTIKIALAHLLESPDYYTRLKEMEKQADIHWDSHKSELSGKKTELNVLINAVK